MLLNASLIHVYKDVLCVPYISVRVFFFSLIDVNATVYPTNYKASGPSCSKIAYH